jgi:hypothetical protein
MHVASANLALYRHTGKAPALYPESSRSGKIADKRKALSAMTAAARLRRFGMTVSAILTGS